MARSSNPLVDMAYPALEEYANSSDIKNILYDNLTSYYYYSEIAPYYDYQFLHYFNVEWNIQIVKYAPLVQGAIDNYFNVSSDRDETLSRDFSGTYNKGTKKSSERTLEGNDTTTYGRKSEVTSENTTQRTENESRDVTDTQTQYEQQLVNRTSSDERDNTDNTTQNGSYDTLYSGTDTVATSRTENETVSNIGADDTTEGTTETRTIKSFDYEKFSSFGNMPSIIDKFVGEFYNLFMEVLNV